MLCEDVKAEGWGVGWRCISRVQPGGWSHAGQEGSAHSSGLEYLYFIHLSGQTTKNLSPGGPSFLLGAHPSIIPGFPFLNLTADLLKSLTLNINDIRSLK